MSIDFAISRVQVTFTATDTPGRRSSAAREDERQGMPAALLYSFRCGEREALELLYRENVAEVQRSLRRRLARARRLTQANLCDVTQEVFARAFSVRARCRYDGGRAFGPFLHSIARNVSIDWLRRTQHEAEPHIEADEALLTSDDCLPAFPREMVEMTRAYIRSLEPGLRSVHERRFVVGEAQLEAARTLGISRQRMRTLERRLLEGLRSELDGQRATKAT